MALRPGFRRFAVSIQYHGSSFLGIPYQGDDRENCILPDGTDVRGYYSVEGRLRRALTAFFGEDKYENIQVSSRTDRGVHAIKNTLHVDIQTDVLSGSKVTPYKIHQGLNYFLSRQAEQTTPDDEHVSRKRRIRDATQCMRSGDGEWFRHNPMNELRILAVKEAPKSMPNPAGELFGQSTTTDWNARFSAIERTYVYRILHCLYEHDWAAAFEWDRSWRVQDPTPLNVPAMQPSCHHVDGQTRLYIVSSGSLSTTITCCYHE